MTTKNFGKTLERREIVLNADTFYSINFGENFSSTKKINRNFQNFLKSFSN